MNNLIGADKLAVKINRDIHKGEVATCNILRQMVALILKIMRNLSQEKVLSVTNSQK